ncbi:ABC transporter ATP-binding protein [Pseudomonadota bacterium]
MSQVAINFNQVVKKYYRGKRYQPSFREWIDAMFTGESFSRPKFKALNKISFEIKKGQVVGFVGSNGAGKSTILKLMMKITYPNVGKVKVNGSVAGLLELGTGFHPALTGRENVFLYSSILGLKRVEVEQLYPKIVKFAGVSKFMDSPIKQYSSGMLARLGFAVAVHLNPDVLVIDEVLAVGDMAFQKKCMNFMRDYCSNPNHTVVFVSHNIENVRLICDQVIWIEEGKIVQQGDTKKVLKDYAKFQNNRSD